MMLNKTEDGFFDWSLFGPVTGKRIILDLCGGTGSWSAPYQNKGYDVRVIDVKKNKSVRTFPYPDEQVWGVLAAPPCTMFAVSGAWARRIEMDNGTYNKKIKKALAIVDACTRIILMCKPRWWALENPVGTLKNWIGPPRLIFDPCDYGDPYTKKTCLWGEFKEPATCAVQPVSVCPQGSWLMRLGGKSERTKTLRSTTPPGFAKAFCEANP